MKAPTMQRRDFLMGTGAGAAAALLGAPAVQAQAQAQAQAQTNTPYITNTPNAATLPSELGADLGNAQLAGTARLRFFGLDVYDARLWVSPGFRSANYADHALGLELTYLRALSGRAIAERSLKEMRRAATLASDVEQRWLAAMTDAFVDVKAGDRLTGLHHPTTGARFWLNSQPRASIPDLDFSRLFFGIWLSDRTSEPRLRADLLARAAP